MNNIMLAAAAAETISWGELGWWFVGVVFFVAVGAGAVVASRDAERDASQRKRAARIADVVAEDVATFYPAGKTAALFREMRDEAADAAAPRPGRAAPDA